MNQNFQPRSSVKGYRSRPLIDDFSVRRTRPKPASKINYRPNINTNNLNRQTNVSNSNIIVKPSLDLPKNIVTSNKSTTKTPKPKNLKKKLITKNNIIYTLAISLVVLAIAFNGFNIINKKTAVYSGTQVNSNTSSDNSTQEQSETTSTFSNIDETEPKKDTYREYKVASDLPRYINIPAIGVNAKILRLGVNNKNEILTPKNVFDTGWYEGSNKPNEPGAVFINGHVSGPNKKGIFYNIKKLNNGDVIKLELGNADLIEYKVVHKEDVPVDQVNMNKVLRSYDIDKQGLNLMTCGGEFDKSSDSFKNRTIIYAVKI